MLKIDSDKLWKLLKEDSKIQQELTKYIKEVEAKRLEAQEIVNKQKEKIAKLKGEKEKLKKKQQELDNLEAEKNKNISILEFRKLFAQMRLNRLNRQITSIFRSKKKKKRLKEVRQRLEEEISEICLKQDRFYDDISKIKEQRNDNLKKNSDLKWKIQREEEQLELDEQNLQEWEDEKDKKTTRFYQATYEKVSENFIPCQELVVPDLKKKNKITEDEAREKANPILIDEEYLLSSPEHLKVRRLTKEEQEDVQKAS